jgi:hypothetical protein
MNKIMKKPLIIPVLLLLVGCAGPKLEYTMKIPTECGNQISPNGEPEKKRYTTAYEAFWWQCIKEKSENINKTCRIACSGTPCATFGCGDGGLDAENQISVLITKFGQDSSQEYLRKLSRTEECKEKTKYYFGERN